MPNSKTQSPAPRLADFVVQSPRPLPVILLADVSGSMKENGKIDALNVAVSEMIRTFAAEEASRVQISVAIITFGGLEAQLHQPFSPAAEVRWTPMEAKGKTPLGSALRLATKLMSDPQILPTRKYKPVLILVSDGQPNHDDWKQSLAELLGNECAKKAFRLALAIGPDADAQMLAEFLRGSGQRVLAAPEAKQIRRFFDWVTMTVTTRTRSATPNSEPVPMPPDDLPEIEY